MQASAVFEPARLPPGRRSLPVLGALPFLFSEPTPQRLERMAGQYGDLFLFQLGQVPTVVISHPGLAAQAFERSEIREPESGILNPAPPSGGVFAGPGCSDRWAALRRLATEQLARPQVMHMLLWRHVEPMAEELVQRVERLVDAGKPFNPFGTLNTSIAA